MAVNADAHWYRWEGEDLVLRVRLQPRASRERIEGPEGDRLRVRVHAPPTDGEANDALLRLLAAACGVPRSRVSLIRGHRARDKDLRVEGPRSLPDGVAAP